MRLQRDLDAVDGDVGVLVELTSTPRSLGLPLKGHHCRLEPLRAAHAQSLWQAFTDPNVWKYLGVGPFADVNTFEAWLRSVETSRDPQFFAVVVDETALGFTAFLRIDCLARSCEVGWIAYSPKLQRSRAATEAMFLMMGQAFASGYRRYEWKCNALNAPSIMAAHRLGFSFEGLFRNALIVKGRNRDTAWFSVIDRDWPDLRSAFERWLEPSNFDSAGRQRERLSDLTSSTVADRFPALNVQV